MQPQHEHEICVMDCGDPNEFHGEFNSDDHERLEGKENGYLVRSFGRTL
jgi:hypothetical protein